MRGHHVTLRWRGGNDVSVFCDPENNSNNKKNGEEFGIEFESTILIKVKPKLTPIERMESTRKTTLLERIETLPLLGFWIKRIFSIVIFLSFFC